LLDSSLFDQQDSYFVVTMKTNNHGALHTPQFGNPTNRMWRHVTSNAIVVSKSSKYVKLVEMTIVMVLDIG
jgi:hypothetical protein